MTNTSQQHDSASLVLYCLIRQRVKEEGPPRFLLMEKQGQYSFPCTRFRPSEGLYSALVRPMEDDLGLSAESYYPEVELSMIPCDGNSKHYAGMKRTWHLYPVDLSLTKAGQRRLSDLNSQVVWWTLDQILEKAEEPNVLAIAKHLKSQHNDLVNQVYETPSMDALASHWSGHHKEGVRLVRGSEIRTILGAGERAFNLRVADPYLPYQKQGLGFTWSFFTAKDKQDVHVHSMPCVEIYGVMEGRLQLWHKPMNERGVRTWQHTILEAGDWAEVEPLYCHFAAWLTPQSLGTVIKAAGAGELAGVGKIGTAGKTVCTSCSMKNQCAHHPNMVDLLEEYQKPFDQRNYDHIRFLSEAGDGGCKQRNSSII